MEKVTLAEHLDLVDPLPFFVLQFLWFVVAWTAIGTLFVNPRLRGSDPERALTVWLAPQLFRVLGLGLLVPNLAPQLGHSFAAATAVGDSITAILALMALVALDRRWRHARALAWTCTVVGTADVLIALVHAAGIGAARYLTAQWYVAALGVPLMLVSHVMVWRILLTGRPPGASISPAASRRRDETRG